TRDAAAKSSQSAQPDASRDVSPKAPGATDSAPAAQSPPLLALRMFALAGAANSGLRSTLSGLLPRAPAARDAAAAGAAGQAGNATSGEAGEHRARYAGGRSATGVPNRRRKFGMLALLAVLIVCLIAIVRYEMARAEQQELFEAERREYLAPPPS